MDIKKKLTKIAKKKRRNTEKSLVLKMRESNTFQKIFHTEINTDFILSPVILKEAIIERKKRIIVHLQPQDQLYHAYLAKLLINSYSHKNLYSYTPKKSSYVAVQNFAKFIRKNTTKKGLYLYSFDIKKYTENIPLHSKSKLWDYIEKLASKKTMLAVQKCLRIENTNGFCYFKGILFGSPLAPPIYNLYAKEIDKLCEKAEFAIRYCDDLLIATKNEATLFALQKEIQQKLQELELSIKTEKEQYVHLIKSGFSNSKCRGAEYIDHLGFRIFANGTIGLPQKKLRSLYSELKQILIQSRKLLQKKSFEYELQFYISSINSFLTDSQFQQTYVRTLLAQVTSRRQLRDIDRTIASYISRTLTKSDLKIPAIVLYQKGLLSVVALRNNK